MFSAEPVVPWDHAMAEGRDPSTLQSGKFFGGAYATDWSYDARGNLAAALTGFCVVDRNPQPCR
jgi:hypothetical protein